MDRLGDNGYGSLKKRHQLALWLLSVVRRQGPEACHSLLATQSPAASHSGVRASSAFLRGQIHLALVAWLLRFCRAARADSLRPEQACCQLSCGRRCSMKCCWAQPWTWWAVTNCHSSYRYTMKIVTVHLSRQGTWPVHTVLCTCVPVRCALIQCAHRWPASAQPSAPQPTCF